MGSHRVGHNLSNLAAAAAAGQAFTTSLLLTFPETGNAAVAGLVARIPGFDPGYQLQFLAEN